MTWIVYPQLIKKTEAVSNQPKYIAGFRSLPMHFKQDLICYQTPSVIKEIVIEKSLELQREPNVRIFDALLN